jgi:hypothetical protein
MCNLFVQKFSLKEWMMLTILLLTIVVWGHMTYFGKNKKNKNYI